MGKRDKRKRARRKKEQREARKNKGPVPDRLDPPPPLVEPAGPYRWRVRRIGAMRVEGLIYADEGLLELIHRDRGAQQVANVATLPGIVGRALAMPDIHWGYGFPIGGVAAFDASRGVVSPGGIGYDINCGVRLVSTGLAAERLDRKLEQVVASMQQAVPAGLGWRGSAPGVERLSLDDVMSRGAAAAVDAGFGDREDLTYIEEGGLLEGADPGAVSDRARQRASKQLGTLGSGNHFVELQRVDRVLDAEAAEIFGLAEGRLVLMIHTGSRGLGHQVCTDAVREMGAVARAAGIALPDRQLACAPLGSPAADQYLAAMAAAANFAFANRQVIDSVARRALALALDRTEESLRARVVYDLCHNIAKFEEHPVEGRPTRVLVHRKGATRALGPADPRLPERYRPVGQPVLVPGDMGRASWVLAGQGEEEAFASSCHGAGRLLSRSDAVKKGHGRDLAVELAKAGVIARAASRKTLTEEMPEAYKDVDRVVDVVVAAGLCRPVARLVPLGVIKG